MWLDRTHVKEIESKREVLYQVASLLRDVAQISVRDYPAELVKTLRIQPILESGSPALIHKSVKVLDLVVEILDTLWY